MKTITRSITMTTVTFARAADVLNNTVPEDGYFTVKLEGSLNAFNAEMKARKILAKEGNENSLTLVGYKVSEHKYVMNLDDFIRMAQEV